MMTAVSGCSRRSCSASHRPSWPGMRKSQSATAVGAVGQQLERLIGAGRDGDARSRATRATPHQMPDAGLVVDDEHGALRLVDGG